jgi:hypothetical protein
MKLNEYLYLVLRLGMFWVVSRCIYHVVLRHRNFSKLPSAKESGRKYRRNSAAKYTIWKYLCIAFKYPANYTEEGSEVIDFVIV